jgi:hypothetical protein
MANTKIPIELSSTPSIVDNGNATALTINSSENAKFEGLVGINKDINASVALSVGADATSATSYGLEVTNSSANTRFLVNGEGSSIFYKTDNAEGMRFNASTGGLTFNGDTAAANALDDYEEGEWTPAVSGGTSAGTTTHTHQNGQYVKVGELVSVTCFVRYTAATGSGYLKLTGLPYAIGNRTQNYPVAATIVDGLNWGGGTYIQALSVPGLQETNFYYMIDDANAGRQDLNNETAAIRFTMTYRT